MAHIRVSLAFTRDTDTNLHNRATSVSDGLYTATIAYPTPPFAQTVLDAANKAFDDAVPVAKAGGPLQTADKNNKRNALIALLRQLAAYVQTRHGDDLAVLLSSGFEAVVTNHAPAVITVPHIRDILNGGTGELIIRVDPMDNIRVFAAQIAVVGPGGLLGPYLNGGLHNDSRHISLPGLIPGTLYSVQIQAVGGGQRISSWSDAVQHMCL
ncbi:MAG: fibronectin type III domain-containing protein [Chthoniobacteraceae bacterium]